MQVFYVNIGGGEPTVRPDFWELVDYATAHHVGVKFSTNGVKITPAIARRLAGSDYVDVQISLDGATAEVNDAVRGPGSYAHGAARHGQPGRAGFAGFKISVVVTRQNVGQLDEFKAHRRPVRRAAAAHPAAPVRPRRRRLGRAAPDRRPAAPAVRLAGRRTARTCSPATRSSTWPATAQALPGLNLCGAGPGGLPDRPGRRRLRLPVRHPRRASWPATSAARAASPRCGGTRSCSPSCAARSPAGPARRARPTTPAGAAAWRRSSSPGCRWTGPTRSASRATASGRSPPRVRGAAAVRGTTRTGHRPRRRPAARRPGAAHAGRRAPRPPASTRTRWPRSVPDRGAPDPLAGLAPPEG